MLFGYKMDNIKSPSKRDWVIWLQNEEHSKEEDVKYEV